MAHPIKSTEGLGELIRRVRKAQGLRQDDLAGMAGSSHVFVLDVERGKPTVQLGKVLALLQELGIRLVADLPETTTHPPATRKRARKRNG